MALDREEKMASKQFSNNLWPNEDLLDKLYMHGILLKVDLHNIRNMQENIIRVIQKCS